MLADGERYVARAIALPALLETRSCWHTFSPFGKQEATDETRVSPLVFSPARNGAWSRGLRPLGPAVAGFPDQRRRRMGARKPEHGRCSRGFHRWRAHQVFHREFHQRA